MQNRHVEFLQHAEAEQYSSALRVLAKLSPEEQIAHLKSKIQRRGFHPASIGQLIIGKAKLGDDAHKEFNSYCILLAGLANKGHYKQVQSILTQDGVWDFFAEIQRTLLCRTQFTTYTEYLFSVVNNIPLEHDEYKNLAKKFENIFYHQAYSNYDPKEQVINHILAKRDINLFTKEQLLENACNPNKPLGAFIATQRKMAGILSGQQKTTTQDKITQHLNAIASFRQRLIEAMPSGIYPNFELGETFSSPNLDEFAKIEFILLSLLNNKIKQPNDTIPNALLSWIANYNNDNVKKYLATYQQLIKLLTHQGMHGHTLGSLIVTVYPKLLIPYVSILNVLADRYAPLLAEPTQDLPEFTGFFGVYGDLIDMLENYRLEDKPSLIEIINESSLLNAEQRERFQVVASNITDTLTTTSNNPSSGKKEVMPSVSEHHITLFSSQNLSDEQKQQVLKKAAEATQKNIHRLKQDPQLGLPDPFNRRNHGL